MPRRIQEELQQLRPREVAVRIAAPLFERLRHNAMRCRAAARPPRQRANARNHGSMGTLRLRWTTGSLPPITPFLCLKIISACCRWKDLDLPASPAAASAAGAILHYVRSTQRGTLEHVDRIGFYDRQNYLVLDAVTVRNLELIEPLFAGTDVASRSSARMDATLTPMGKRLLRSWMLRPSIDLTEINARLDAVEVR